MDKKVFFIWIILCIATQVIRLVYELLKYKKILEPGKLSFVIIFTNMALLWTSWYILCSIDIYTINFPDIIRYFGLSLFGVGIVLFLTALFTIKSLESYDGDLITKGIYSKIRHPMYLGFVFWLIGLPLFFEALVSCFLSFLFIANVLFWRYLEDKELEKRFVAYKEYKKKTIF
jgi:protein-S-isoprenylcysteine O-methyltransferase Ste14